MEQKRIIIIGAGPAGLTAGYELLKRSQEYEIIILEKTQMAGGISRTIVHNGNRMDIGGHRFFSKDDHVMEWWKSIMPLQGKPAVDDAKLGRKVVLNEGGPDPEKVDRVMLTRRRVSRIYYNRKFFDYPVKINWNTIHNMGIVTTVTAGISYIKAMLHKLPENSLRNFYINRFGKKLYRMFFESYTEKVWGRNPKDISADWGKQRVKGLSMVEILKDILAKVLPWKREREVETSLIEEFIYPKYGPGQLWETVAEEIEARGGVVQKGCEVVALKSEGDRIVSVTYRQDGKLIEKKADYVISSMPLQQLVAGLDNVEKEPADIAAGLEYRDFVTVGLLVDRLAIRNTTKLKTWNNLIPDCWIYVQDGSVKLGRIQIFNNWSPYLLENPDETIWLGLEYFCSEKDRDWNLPVEKWIERGKNELLQMGIIGENCIILDAHCEKVEKAYPAYFGTYNRIQELIDYLDKYNNLFCVGRNGQHRYNNMDHSMMTAFEATDNIIKGKMNKRNVWNVNTEQSYHEKKQEIKK